VTRVLCIGLLWMAIPAWAHHAFAAEYEETKLVTVSGTVTRFRWTNPHAWLYVEGKDDSGKVIRPKPTDRRMADA
jgi:hypothetical protein